MFGVGKMIFVLIFVVEFMCMGEVNWIIVVVLIEYFKM